MPVFPQEAEQALVAEVRRCLCRDRDNLIYDTDSFGALGERLADTMTQLVKDGVEKPT